MKKVKNLFVIPLRTKSKRIKDKNIRLLNGKPLFLYQLEIALSIDCEKKIVVVSETDQYFKFILNENVEKVIRPREIAGDFSKTEETLLFLIDYYENKNIRFENVILLQATSPLNKVEYVETGLAFMDSGKFNSILTYCEFSRFFLDDTEDLIDRKMHQVKDKRKMETGCFWITKAIKLIESRNRLVYPVGEVKVDYWAGLIDIDEEIDLKIAELLLKINY